MQDDLLSWAYTWVVFKLSQYLVVHIFSKVIATEINILYLLVFGQWLNIPFERIAYCPAIHGALWSVTKFFIWNIQLFAKYQKVNYCLLTSSPLCTLVSNQFFKWNIQSLAKYQKINYFGFGGNIIAKFIYY